MGNRKRKHREPLFWLEAAFIVLLLAGAYVIGSYARAKQSDSLQEVFVADHGTNVVEVTDAQGTITGSEVVDYDELISDYRKIPARNRHFPYRRHISKRMPHCCVRHSDRQCHKQCPNCLLTDKEEGRMMCRLHP